MKRIILLVKTSVFGITIFLGGCGKSVENNVASLTSEDFCTLCSQSPVHMLDNGTFMVTSKIITPK
jgi:hypothetical protein